MAPQRIVLLTFEGQFAQLLDRFESMDLDAIRAHLGHSGFTTVLSEYAELVEQGVDEQAIYVCGSHQNREVKAYIDDVLLARFVDRSNLVPSLALIRVHDNKGIQSLLGRDLGLPLIRQSYHVLPAGRVEIDRPKVLKQLAGAGGAQIEIVDSADQLERKLRKMHRRAIPVGELQRELEIKTRDIKKDRCSIEKNRYIRRRIRFVLQDLIPGLDHDFKVLVFGDHLFVVKRFTKKGDFRASGSGLLSWDEPVPDAVLDAAEGIHRRLDAPHSSLDLVAHEGRVHLIEFQVVHFGPKTLLEASHYFVRGEDRAWRRVPKENRTFEGEYASALAHFLKHRQ